jgi:hypothetical protein
MKRDAYMWASVQTVRGCAKHCSFCSVWRTDGQRPRQRPERRRHQGNRGLRRLGFRFIAWPTIIFIRDVHRYRPGRAGRTRPAAWKVALPGRAFRIHGRLAELPADIFSQITMEAAEDPKFLDAMRKARIKGALVGVEAVTEEGLKAVYKDFNLW